MAQTARKITPIETQTYYTSVTYSYSGSIVGRLQPKSTPGFTITYTGIINSNTLLNSLTYFDKLTIGSITGVANLKSIKDITTYGNPYFAFTSNGSFTGTDNNKRFTFIEV